VSTEDLNIGLKTSKNDLPVKPFLSEFTLSPKKQKEIKYTDNIINLKSIDNKPTHRGTIPQNSKLALNINLELILNSEHNFNGPYSNPLMRAGSNIDNDEYKIVPLVLPNIKSTTVKVSDKFKR
jgi:hypothetical protein